MPRDLETRIAVHDEDGVTIRGRSLEADLIGRAGYADVLMLGTLGRLPDPDQRRVLDGCLVALMEAGLNPSTLVTRMTALAAPDQAQAAMAAGLLTVGDVYVGSVQECARLLATIAAAEDPDRSASAAVDDLLGRAARVPGLGHGRHGDDDPRALAVLRLAADRGCAGEHHAALDTLRRTTAERLGRSLVVNVTGAVAAALLDLGFPVSAARPIALAARAGGLVGHVVEELHRPTAKDLWSDARSRVRYREPAGPDRTHEHDQEVTP
ncbi:citryl-CoA lyase [Actinophytocola gossypii]|uniref:citrate synthase (unknown stereospecificity) n=1 Tax=Actinophytocola gossypii TaxID=2812003 RepID=A0ABT2JDE2_9PSEU|nr:citryl-CoA lyase [Actinophytocola gossypii]MCT2585885.1 citryl-CoA lyase [Actinophytocola gossypii]